MPPIQNFTPNDYNAGIQNWMISQADDHSIVVANGDGILHFNSDWNHYPTTGFTLTRSIKSIGDKVYSGSTEDFGYWLKSSNGYYVYYSLPQILDLKEGNVCYYALLSLDLCEKDIKLEKKTVEFVCKNFYNLLSSLRSRLVFSKKIKPLSIKLIKTINKILITNDK